MLIRHDLRKHFFDIFFDRKIFFLSLFEDFITMFVSSGLELNFVSEESFVAEINVGKEIIDGVTAEDFAYRSENAYCPPASMVRDVVLMAVDDLCGKF